jgi:hypothetical protein
MPCQHGHKPRDVWAALHFVEQVIGMIADRIVEADARRLENLILSKTDGEL